jgi:hypothetical protein
MHSSAQTARRERSARMSEQGRKRDLLWSWRNIVAEANIDLERDSSFLRHGHQLNPYATVTIVLTD